jgi:hypothetical protein
MSSNYNDIVAIPYIGAREKIAGRECWMVVQGLRNGKKFRVGTKVRFEEEGKEIKGKIIGLEEEREGGWPRLFVKGKGGTPDFDLIMSSVYISVGSGIFTTIRRYISSPLLRNAYNDNEAGSNVVTKRNEPSCPRRRSWSNDEERGGICTSSSTESVENDG